MADPRPDNSLNLLQCSHLGVQLALTTALCCYGGYRLDQWLDTSPVLLIVGAFTGLGTGMWLAVREVERVTGPRAASGPAPEDAPSTASGEADDEPS